MSHSMGEIEFKDGTVLYFEYNGTCDIVINCLWKTKEEVSDNWRKYKENTCDCGRDEPVEIYSYYGGGFSWSGRACRHCMALTEGLDPHGFLQENQNYWFQIIN